MAKSNKDKVFELLKAIETGATEPIAYVNANKYTQHNLGVADGLAGFGALLKALPDIAYVHVLATADDEVLMGMRRAWPTAFILNPGGQIGPHESTLEQGERWLANGADLISYGRAYIGNPDLVERFRLGLPLAGADKETWFQTEAGYVDYPSYQH